MMSRHKYTHKDIKNPFELYEPDVDDISVTLPTSDESEQDETIDVEKTDKPVKDMTKEEKFKYYAEKRVNTILKELAGLSDMASTYAGVYNKTMVDSMIITISSATNSTKEIFQKRAHVLPTFSFD